MQLFGRAARWARRAPSTIILAAGTAAIQQQADAGLTLTNRALVVVVDDDGVLEVGGRLGVGELDSGFAKLHRHVHGTQQAGPGVPQEHFLGAPSVAGVDVLQGEAVVLLVEPLGALEVVGEDLEFKLFVGERGSDNLLLSE